MSVFYTLLFPVYPKFIALSTSFILILDSSPELKKKLKKNFFQGIENCSSAKSDRRDGQGKSDRQINKVYYRHERQDAQRSVTA